VFTITGASSGATCAADEISSPPGYYIWKAGCNDGDPINGSCTLVNSRRADAPDFFTVYKDFSDNNGASVGITLSCSSGTIADNTLQASEGSPAVFSITGASTGTTCTATEPSVPSGYTRNQADCQNGDPINGSCTIINTKNTSSSGTFTVHKDFSDNNTASVGITLTCSSGTIADNTLQAREGVPAVFTITGASAGTTCTATEPSVPSGYTRNQTDCQNKAINGSCTIVNTKNPTSQPVDILRSNFENGSAGGWSTGTNVSVQAVVAVGQYAL
jgi:hypothetical protein